MKRLIKIIKTPHKGFWCTALIGEELLVDVVETNESVYPTVFVKFKELSDEHWNLVRRFDPEIADRLTSGRINPGDYIFIDNFYSVEELAYQIEVK